MPDSPEPPSTLEQRTAELSAALGAVRNPQQRLSRLVDLAKTRSAMPQELRRDEHLVPGCQVRLWFVHEVIDGRCRFQTDSDAITLKALTGLFCDLLNGLPVAETARFDAGFLEELGILRQLAESRRATVLRVAQSIRELAANQMPDTSPSPALFFDAHNHLQDDRFGGRQDELLATCRTAGVARMVVNGACEEDWPAVADLARRHPGLVVPSFGYHPWYLHERTGHWRATLVRFLDETPGAAIGEIGLDRWILDQPEQRRKRLGPSAAPHPPASLVEQEEAFVWQLRLAGERNLPVSIHCLQAFGRLQELLAANPRPERGFLLHSYGGPVEMVPIFAQLGACFSFPGYYLHERKARQREVFRHIPSDRLLVETDAPDQPLPAPEFNLASANGGPINHPANLAAVYRGLATVLDKPLDVLVRDVAENFQRLFGR